MTDGASTSAPVVDVYVTEAHPHYQVWADGQIIEHLTARCGPPLTWSQQWDIAANYRDAIVSGVMRLPHAQPGAPA